ncbi:amidohydrolase family protein [Bacillus pinisoli]|uniref:amidohydrolase family protein n=1 Tax=Bacillus pinisoli TaxID=2901866 RepID=UPI001FF35764|nr:amidohydrolase family protein [Bacillus pinisoli]
MLLKNASYLNHEFSLAKGDLFINDGKIIIDGLPQDDTLEVIDCDDYVIIPGLFNSHYHGYSYVAKGIGRDIKIEEWCKDSPQGRVQNQLFKSIDGLSDEEYQVICMKSYMEMAKKGITFVSESEPGNNPGITAEGIRKIGLRGFVDTYHQIEEYYERQQQNLTFGTHLLEEEDITDETILSCLQAKEKYPSSLFLTHCMENDWRRDLIYSAYNKSSIVLYKEHGLLDHKTVLFHSVYANDHDIELIRDAGSSIVHCPVSNHWTGAGIAPIGRMLEKGINVCIGTDYASTDIWETMKAAYFLLKNHRPMDRFTAEDIFKMATISGAKAFHQPSLGSIKHGYDADLVFIKKDCFIPSIHTDGFSNLVHNLLFETKEEQIQHCLVQGRWIMRDRQLLLVDEEEINKKYMDILNKLFGNYK